MQVMLDYPWDSWVSNLYGIMHVKENACLAKHDVPLTALATHLLHMTCQKEIMHQALPTEQTKQCFMPASYLDSMHDCMSCKHALYATGSRSLPNKLHMCFDLTLLACKGTKAY